MNTESSIRERYRAALDFTKVSVFRDDRGEWVRMEPDGPLLGTPYPTWAGAMRGGK